MTIDLTDDETAALAQLLRRAIDEHRYSRLGDPGQSRSVKFRRLKQPLERVESTLGAG
jgi:hypothetical protein